LRLCLAGFFKENISKGFVLGAVLIIAGVILNIR